jgi:hypothetical protein
VLQRDAPGLGELERAAPALEQGVAQPVFELT